MTYKKKTWLNNMWEGFLGFILSSVVGVLGFFATKLMAEVGGGNGNGDTYVLIVNGFPLPLILMLIPGIFTLSCIYIALGGVRVILTTLYMRIIKKEKGYNVHAWSFLDSK